MFVFTQTFKSTKEVRNLFFDANDDQDAREYAEKLLDSSVDITTVRVFKQMAFVQKIESKVWV